MIQYVAQFPDSKNFLRYILPLKITRRMKILHIVATSVGHLILKEGPLYFVIFLIIAKTDSLIGCPVFGQLVQYPDTFKMVVFWLSGKLYLLNECLFNANNTTGVVLNNIYY